MATLLDAFTRANTAQGAGLGTAPSGLVWTQISGQWQIQSNYAYTPTSSASNPIAAVTSVANVDISADVSSAGGDALYFRVVDANNWFRLRVENNTTYVSQGYNQSYSYPSSWQCHADIWATPSYEYLGTADYSSGYDASGTTYPEQRYIVTSCSVSGYSTGNTWVDTSYWSYEYKAVFEKCVAGVVTTLAAYTLGVPTSKLRVVMFGSDYKIYFNNETFYTGVVVDSTFNTAVKHGIGRGYQNNSSTLDNFSITTIDVPPVPTAVTPANGSSVTTGKPTLGSTLTAPASGQRFKGEWQLATNSGFTADVILVTESDTDLRSTSGATTEVLTEVTRLTKLGTWYLRGRTVDEYGQAGPWSSTNTFTVTIAVPNVPTSLTPVHNSTLTTDTPVLQITLQNASDGQKVKGEWQFATNNTFTLNVKTVTEPDTGLRYSGLSSYTVPNAEKLFQGIWYLRGRTVDQYGQVSAWVNVNTLTISHAPNATNLSPTGGINTIYTATPPFDWDFSDTSSTDTQTAYQVILERNDTSALVLDTGKIIAGASNANLAIAAGFKDILLRWKIRLWDSADVVGPYSNYALFKASDPPIITLISPVVPNTNSARPLVDWTFSASGGRTQASYRITFTKAGAGAPALDTGVVLSQNTVYDPVSIFIRNGEVYTIVLTVTDSFGLVVVTSVTITAVYDVPLLVNFSVDGGTFTDSGYVHLTWTNYNYDSGFLRWRVYRRIAGVMPWVLIKEISQSGVNEYKDWNVPADQTYEYIVAQVVDRFGQEIESPIPGTLIPVILEGGNYWLVDPIDENNNCKLFQVKEDNYTDMYEMAEYVIVGRGRHVDYGETIGKSGSLTAQIRDSVNSSARSKKQKIEELKRKRVPVILRTPFGDLYNVSLGDISLSRIAGTGTSEYCDITLPYLEIF